MVQCAQVSCKSKYKSCVICHTHTRWRNGPLQLPSIHASTFASDRIGVRFSDRGRSSGFPALWPRTHRAGAGVVDTHRRRVLFRHRRGDRLCPQTQIRRCHRRYARIHHCSFSLLLSRLACDVLRTLVDNEGNAPSNRIESQLTAGLPRMMHDLVVLLGNGPNPIAPFVPSEFQRSSSGIET